jgi:arylsulfatase A-like enzyme
MPNRPPHVALLALAVALFPSCDGNAPQSAATGAAAVASWRPNVLVVTLDTTRADVLGCYGATHGLTPTLDALAARGVRFADARSPAPVTMPSHASLFTGSWPFQHGVRDNGTFVLGEGATTLAERLHAAGWQTGAFPAAFVVASQFGLAQGFDRYDDLAEATVATGGEDEERKGDVVVDRALAWLATLDRARPFFAWVHFFDPHFPYAPPADLVAAHPFDDDPSRKGNARAKSRHLYQLELASVDRQLARLLAGLAPQGGAEETLIVVVGDHGEGLGDHGEASHATFVYDSTLRVPLLFAQARLPAGKVVDAAVSTVDVTPTLLDLVGLPRDGTAGAPLAATWRDEPFTRERPLYFENCATWFSSGWAPLYGVIEGRFKTIVGPQVRVFDVVADPAEKRDLAESQPDVVARARALLSDYAEQTLAASRHEADPGELEKLQRLGYVQSSASSRRDGLVPPGWQPKGALTPEQGQENQKRYTQANSLWQ